ncbi:hypothetical protein TSUD_119990 [Trifolium subterraneum]|uniref:Uncharacterized protein n=1 Tax=Trifolium subterraneum TaxID=3900 RepID=A0A2Z6NA03_TRISU|nr:hypothetical protein TSUD_119990 [Trifolium subterraneum]
MHFDVTDAIVEDDLTTVISLINQTVKCVAAHKPRMLPLFVFSGCEEVANVDEDVANVVANLGEEMADEGEEVADEDEYEEVTDEDEEE